MGSKEPEWILVVDDDEHIRGELVHYLRQCGYIVLEAETTDEAVAVLSRPDNQLKIVLAAAECGGSINGFGLASWMRKERISADVILAGSRAGAAVAAINLCGSGPKVPRPYDHEKIVEIIRLRLTDAAEPSYPKRKPGKE